MANMCADGQLVTGTNAGTVAGAAPTDAEWANAKQGAAGLQAALDQAVAGNTIHIARTFTLAADIDIDQASGAAGSMIRVLGYNYNGGSPTNDGTVSIIDADSAADHCILVDDKDYWHWENVEFRNSNVGANVAVSNTAEAENWLFLNCISRNAADHGWGRGNGSGKAFQQTRFTLCHAISNAGNGIDTGEFRNQFLFCTAINNAIGIGSYDGTVIGCVVHGNSTEGIRPRGASSFVWHCVVDGNAEGIGMQGGPLMVAGCRITNSTGAAFDELAASTVYSLWNYINNNGAADNVTELVENVRGSGTNLTAGSQGYRDIANNLFELVMGAAGFRTELDIDGSMSAYFNRGLPNVPLVGPRG